MTRFFALLAAAGLTISTSAALAQPLSQSLAQATSDQATPDQVTPNQEAPTQESPTQYNVTQFLSDSAPAECTIKVTSVSLEDSNREIADILSAVPTIPCDAVSGTDNGNSKNFNFLNVSDNNFYKVITSSTPISPTADETYQFSVEGVKVVPLDAEGTPVNLAEVEYLYPSDTQVCTADAIEQPRSVVCTFEVKDAGNVMVGQLSYSW